MHSSGRGNLIIPPKECAEGIRETPQVEREARGFPELPIIALHFGVFSRATVFLVFLVFLSELCNHESMSCLRSVVALLLVFCSYLSATRLDDATRQLARDIFQQLVEINTTDSVGNTTIAAEAMAKRLLDAGFPATDVSVVGPNGRKGNLVARLRGRGVGAFKPILIIGHLDVGRGSAQRLEHRSVQVR